MKRNLFLVALAATALASCSQDEIMEVQQDAIKFNVVTENQTRAADVYCNNNTMSSFTVYGTYTTGTTTQMYMNGDVITKQTDGTWKNTTATRYWSDTEDAHNFYAIANGTVTLPTSWENNAAPKVENFTPATDVSKQVDLVYAVATGKDKDDAQVTLNFRHALSQIEFKAKNTNAQMYVEIEAVQVGNAPSKGTFTFPTASTDSNIEGHTTEAGATETEGTTYNKGTWSLSTTTTDIANYTVDVKKMATDDAAEATAIPISGDNTAVNLTISTHAAENVTKDYSKSMLLVPNATVADDGSIAGTTAWEPSTDLSSGTYLAVKCKIYNIADAPGDESDAEGTTSAPKYDESDITLHSGWAIVPVSFKWEQGKKYIYTFIFGEGNGGYDGGENEEPDPDPTPEGEEDPDEDPEPVLVPMTYSITVDDFVKGSEEDVDMETVTTTTDSNDTTGDAD